MPFRISLAVTLLMIAVLVIVFTGSVLSAAAVLLTSGVVGVLTYLSLNRTFGASNGTE